jgi:hypothetical protein
MKKQDIILLYGGIIFVLLIPTIFYICSINGLNKLHHWELCCAIEDSIKYFYEKNSRLPESWDEIKQSYITGKLHLGYGFDKNELDKNIDVNFQGFFDINTSQNSDEIFWILKVKSTNNHIMEQEFNNRILSWCLYSSGCDCSKGFFPSPQK